MKKGRGLLVWPVKKLHFVARNFYKFYCVSYTLCLSSAKIFHTTNGVQSTHKITPKFLKKPK